MTDSPPIASPVLDLEFLRARVFPHLPPDAWNKHFLGHYGFGSSGADFHATLSADLDNLHKRRGTKRAYVAPRGGAKSTIVTMAYALRCAVQGWENHIVILSDSDDQAKQHLKFIAAELEGNSRLKIGYPSAFGPGPEWSTDRLRLPNGVLIEALGTGSKIHGRRNRQHRPSLIILDDVQSQLDIISPTKREHTWLWFTRAVIPAGDERTNYLSVGTALHREAVAVRALTLPGWTGRTFQALHEYPERMDLWEAWERLLTNLADDGRIAAAAFFFQRNRPEMERGSRSYWPAKRPIDWLMAKRAEIGEGAFDTEYQGVPTSPAGTLWPASYFDWDGFWFADWPQQLILRVIALDPSRGESDKSDWQAHAMAGLTADGTIWLDCDVQREPPTAMLERTIRLARDWCPVNSVVFESNATMGLLAPMIEAVVREFKIILPWECLNNVANKDIRIQRADPYLRRRQIRVRRTRGGMELVQQWRDHPLATHDDAADAVGTALEKLQILAGGQR
jgi:hypothetical protein